MLVCIEDTSPFKEEEVPYGYITDKQYNDVPHTPDNHALMEKAFLVAADIQVALVESRSHMQP